jgi:sensor histidine kinase regulating citrate/malate metabolism
VYFFSQVNDQQQQFAGVAMLLLVALLIWSLMVNAHIFRTALEIKPSSAVMLTVAYTILSLMLVGLAVSGVA